MRLCVIIVNFCTPRLTIEAVGAAKNQLRACDKIYLVDGASPDGSAEILRHRFADDTHVELLLLADNKGFAFANNCALKRAFANECRFDYFLLLNPDTIAMPQAFESLLCFMENSPTVGIAGSRLENLDHSPQVSAFRFPSILGEVENAARLGIVSKLLHQFTVAPPVQSVAHRADWVAGASMIVRREVFDDIGLLDERYFMYFEEVDFCKRARKSGWDCWYVPDSRVIHLVGQSSGIRSADVGPKRRPAYVFQSRRRYFQKQHGWLYAVTADVAWLLVFPLWRVRRWIQRKANSDPPKLWVDMLKHSSLFHREPREFAP